MLVTSSLFIILSAIESNVNIATSESVAFQCNFSREFNTDLNIYASVKRVILMFIDFFFIKTSIREFLIFCNLRY